MESSVTPISVAFRSSPASATRPPRLRAARPPQAAGDGLGAVDAAVRAAARGQNRERPRVGVEPVGQRLEVGVAGTLSAGGAPGKACCRGLFAKGRLEVCITSPFRPSGMRMPEICDHFSLANRRALRCRPSAPGHHRPIWTGFPQGYPRPHRERSGPRQGETGSFIRHQRQVRAAQDRDRAALLRPGGPPPTPRRSAGL